MPRPNSKRWLLKNFWGGQGQGRDRPSNGKWYLPFCSLYFFFLERETHKANINWIFKEFFIPRLIHVNVNYRRHFVFIICLIHTFSYTRIFVTFFTTILQLFLFFFTYTKIIIQECVKRVKNREEKNTRIISSFMVERIYVYIFDRGCIFEWKERTDVFLRIFQKVVPFQKVEAREIFMFIVSSSMARKGTQLIPKSKRHERDNAVIPVFHTLWKILSEILDNREF